MKEEEVEEVRQVKMTADIFVSKEGQSLNRTGGP